MHFQNQFQLRDEDLSKDMQESNWFSAPSALRVYGQYLNLDKDHNGMLSQEELARLVLLCNVIPVSSVSLRVCKIIFKINTTS